MILIIIPTVAASVDEQIDTLVSYAELYETGDINYLELQVQTGIARQEINEILGSFEFEDHGPGGITSEAAEQYFGTPEKYTDWAWDVANDDDVQLEEPVPAFEKIIFDGKRVQVTFNAWPHLYDGELYYWTEFEVHFKKDLEVSVSQMISEITSLGNDYYSGSGSAQETAEKMSEYREMLSQYRDQSSKNCEDLMGEFFSEDELQSNEDRVNWIVDFYEGENLDVFLTINMPDCDEDCHWPWVNFWFDIRSYDDKFEEEDKGSFEHLDREMYKDYTIEQLNSEMSQTLSEARSVAADIEDGDASHSDLYNLGEKLMVINEALSEKYYWGTDENSAAFEQRKEDLKNMLSSYSYKTETLTEKRYEKRLVVNEEENQDAWCRDIGKEECEWDEVCSEGACVNALGGNEDCNNGGDDDGDGAEDCEDPDCAVECGKVCEPVCEDECWSCASVNCQSLCGDCWGCWEEGREDCDSVCESSGCNSCQNACYAEDFCTECNECQQNQQPKDECNEECAPCEECAAMYTEDPSQCETACQSCSDCQKPKNYECYDVCNQMELGLGELETCQSLCDDKVEFYCGGSKQPYPCTDATYICDGNLQSLPCTVYTCKNDDGSERKQTVMCGEEHFCGENQVVRDDICVCIAGYYDCDGDGACESTESCGGTTPEVCDDKIDNDGDYLVDCNDLSECRLEHCGFGPADEPLVCYEGECQSQTDIVVCEEGQTLINGECIDICEMQEDCEEGQICQYGICTTLTQCLADDDCTGYDEICEDGFCKEQEKEGCFFDDECPISQMCQDNECIDKECFTNEECSESELCYDFKCQEKEDECESDIDCPSLMTCDQGFCIESECPEGTERRGDICMDLNSCYDNSECDSGKVCHEGLCVEELKKHPEKTGESCTVAEDCSGERDICSNGFCKEIPEEKYNNLVEGGLISPETPEPTPETPETPEPGPSEPEQEPEQEATPEPTPEPEPQEQEPVQEPETPEPEANEATGLFSYITGNFWRITGNEAVEEPVQEPETPEPEPTPEPTPEPSEPEEPDQNEPGDDWDDTPTGDCNSDSYWDSNKGECVLVDNYYPDEGGDDYGEGGEGGEDYGDDYGSEEWTYESDYDLEFTDVEDFESFDEGEACEVTEDCSANQECDSFDNTCHCERGYFNCNQGWNYWRATDSDGCESTDVTCGGTREICEGGCSEGQVCNEEQGYCECEEGTYNCDGVWSTCESTERCTPCTSNDQCAEPTCDEHNLDYVYNYGCYQGSTWIETKGAIAFSGGCMDYNSGRKDSYIGFDSWGDPFDELHQYQDFGGHKGWCVMELESSIKERNEIEHSLNNEFLTWLFEEHINENPENWDKQMEAIFDVYWSIVDNTRQIAKSSECSDQGYPETNIIDIEYESEYGHIVIWEEMEDLEGQQVPTPYMKVWIFPPEEFMKQEFKKAMAEGRMPGQKGEGGPSADDFEGLRSDTEALEEIENLVAKYDDKRLDAHFTVTDDDEAVFNIDMTLDTEDLIQVKPVETYSKEADITLEIDFDYMYSLIETMEKEMIVESPEWSSKEFSNGLKGAVTKGKMTGKIATGITTGKIKISPLSEVPTATKLMQHMFEH